MIESNFTEYKRTDISEGIDVNKTNLSKECDICHYWYSKYQPYLCNGCHDLMQKAIVYIKGSAYRIHFHIWVKMMQLT